MDALFSWEATFLETEATRKTERVNNPSTMGSSGSAPPVPYGVVVVNVVPAKALHRRLTSQHLRRRGDLDRFSAGRI